VLARATKRHVAVAQSESFFMLFLRSKLTVDGFAMERHGNGEAIDPQKENIFSNRITPREVGGAHHRGPPYLST
jgi:hypothetical protein